MIKNWFLYFALRKGHTVFGIQNRFNLGLLIKRALVNMLGFRSEKA